MKINRCIFYPHLVEIRAPAIEPSWLGWSKQSPRKSFMLLYLMQTNNPVQWTEEVCKDGGTMLLYSGNHRINGVPLGFMVLLLGLMETEVGLYSSFHDLAVYEHGYASAAAIHLAYM